MSKEQKPRRMVGIWIFGIVVAILLTGATAWLEIIKRSYRLDIEGTQKTFQSLSQNAAAMEETKRRRVEYFKNRFIADFPARYAYGAADFMRRLSLVNARGIEPVKLEINPHGQDLAFNLHVAVTADNNDRAREIFSRFYQALNDLDGMVEINVATPTPGAGELKNTAPRGKVKSFFHINGVIEPE